MDNTARLRESHLEAMVEAALGGHDLAPWTPVDDDWQAICKHCRGVTLCPPTPACQQGQAKQPFLR